MRAVKTERQVLYVPDVARILGMTETAVRNHLARGTGAVPPPFKLGGFRLAWLQHDVDKWLLSMSSRR